MIVLVLGGTGMLGHKLVEVLGATPGLRVHCSVRRSPAPEWRAPGVRYHEGVDCARGSAALAPLLRDLAPDVIVNAVGAVKQKDLTAAVDETFVLNATLPHLLPLLNPNPDGRVVHVSTDCVYQGDRGRYRESEAPDALDLYGRSKACGEIAYGRHLTLRTSIVGFEIGAFHGLLSWMLRQPPGARTPGYSRAVFSGLPTLALARQIRDLIVDFPSLAGLYHVASEPIDKHDLLVRMNDALDLGLDVRPDDRVRIDRSLDDSRFREATGSARPSWDALVALLAEDFAARPYAPLYESARELSPTTRTNA